MQSRETTLRFGANEAELLACAKLAASAGQVSANLGRQHRKALTTRISDTLNSYHELAKSHSNYCARATDGCIDGDGGYDGDGDGDEITDAELSREGRLMSWQQNRSPAGWFSIIKQVAAIRLTGIEAPRSVIVGQPIRLRCLYETKGDKLQSLSWIKNGREFYRYQPSERRHPVLVFNSTGINVDVSCVLLKIVLVCMASRTIL